MVNCSTPTIKVSLHGRLVQSTHESPISPQYYFLVTCDTGRSERVWCESTELFLHLFFHKSRDFCTLAYFALKTSPVNFILWHAHTDDRLAVSWNRMPSTHFTFCQIAFRKQPVIWDELFEGGAHLRLHRLKSEYNMLCCLCAVCEISYLCRRHLSIPVAIALLQTFLSKNCAGAVGSYFTTLFCARKVPHAFATLMEPRSYISVRYIEQLCRFVLTQI